MTITSPGGQNIGAFGSQSSETLTPVVQVDSVYGALTDQVETFTDGDGTAVAVNGVFQAHSGTGVGNFGVIRSRRAVVYRPGQAVICRYTALWPTVPGALMSAWAGMFNLLDAFAFGYNGNTFGTLHRHSGAAEIQQLTLNTAASGAENVTITLANTNTTVAVNTTGIANTAQQIVDGDTWDGWSVQADGNTVTFLRNRLGVQNNTFAISSDGTADGTFSQTVAGKAATTDWTPQASWNGESLPFTLNTQVGNVFEIDYQYLGYGVVAYKIEHPHTGQPIIVHRLQYPNTSTMPHTRLPSMKVGWLAASLGGSGTDIQCQGASGMLAVAGKSTANENAKAFQATNLSVGTSFVSVFQIRNKVVFGDVPNQGLMLLKSCSVGSSSTKDTTVQLAIGATLDSETENWTSINANTSLAESDTTADGIGTEGEIVTEVAVGPSGSEFVDLNPLNIQLAPGEKLSVFSKVSSGSAAEVSVTLNWVELK